MPNFKFTATRTIEAEDEDEAKSIFCDESFDFASDADIEEVDDRGNPVGTEQENLMVKSFPVTCLTRADLLKDENNEDRLSKKEVLAISDSEMEYYARKIADNDAFMESFWLGVDALVDCIREDQKSSKKKTKKTAKK